MKPILFFAFAILMIPTSGCAEKKEHHATAANPAIFSAKIDDPRNAAEIAVITPENRFLYLKQSDVDCSGVTSSEGNVSIDLAATAGVEWIDGKPTAVYAFNSAGRYKILIGDNLETELDNSFSKNFMIAYSPSMEMNRHRSEQKNPGCRVNGEMSIIKPL